MITVREYCLNILIKTNGYSRAVIKLEMKIAAKKLGEIVKQRRQELRMNQGELALVSGTGVRFISDLENGKTTCELGKALDVLDNLGLELTFKPKSGG